MELGCECLSMFVESAVLVPWALRELHDAPAASDSLPCLCVSLVVTLPAVGVTPDTA